MTVTDNQLVIDSSLPLDAAPLVKPGMPVAIDEQALGIKATGVVERVADTPGTHGVDGYHIYFEVRVDETPTRLEGFSLRLTIPIESTEGGRHRRSDQRTFSRRRRDIESPGEKTMVHSSTSWSNRDCPPTVTSK